MPITSSRVRWYVVVLYLQFAICVLLGAVGSAWVLFSPAQPLGGSLIAVGILCCVALAYVGLSVVRKVFRVCYSRCAAEAPEHVYKTRSWVVGAYGLSVMFGIWGLLFLLGALFDSSLTGRPVWGICGGYVLIMGMCLFLWAQDERRRALHTEQDEGKPRERELPS